MIEGATLGLRLSNAQAIADAKTTGAVLEDMGNKGETAARKIAASSSPVETAMRKQAVSVEQARVAWAASGGDMGRFAQELQKLVGPSGPVGPDVPPRINRVTEAMLRMRAAAAQGTADAFGAQLSVQMELAEKSAMKLQRGLEGVRAAQQRMQQASQQTQAKAMAGQIAALDPFQTNLAATSRTAEGAKLSLGRLGQQFGNLAGSIAGTSPIVANLLSVMGNFAYGSVLTVGILGGLALLAVAYDKITEGARKAKEKADELTTSLLQQAAAAFQATQAGATAVAWAAEQNLANVQQESGLGWRSMIGTLLNQGRPTIDSTDAAARAKRLADAADAVKQAWANVGKIVTDAMDEAGKKAKELFDKLKAAREKDASEEKQLQDQIAALRLQRTLGELKEIAYVQDVRNDAIKERLQAEERAAQKRAEDESRITDNLVRQMQDTWSQFFQDVLTKGISSFRDLFDGIKQLFFRLIGDMLAAGAMRRMAGVFGGMAAGGAGGGSGGMLSGLGAQMLGQGLSGGLAGGLVGYGIGRAGGGAIGGGLAGAGAGFMVAGPLGALAGGITGLVGGLLGGAAAAREAAAAMRQLQKDYVAATTTFAHDDLGAALAKNAADAEELRKMAQQMYGTLLAVLKDHGVAYNAELKKIAEQEAKNAEIIRRQARQIPEDLQVRLLAAQGLDKQAAALKLQHEQERERQALIDSFGAQIDATESATLALLDQVQTQEKLKAATDAANQSALNMVAGYKLQSTIFGAMTPRSPAAALMANGGDLTVNLKLADGTVLATTVLKNFKSKAQKQFGDSSRWSEIL